MIPEPNLDDRKFDHIVEEAIRLIPQYCPEWTNFNKSDPGITLIELFAWMIEMVIYRLNKVPEKNYISFLNLLGVKLKPPQPARTVLTFSISEKGDQVVIPRATTVSTKPSPEGNIVSFETENDILVINNKIMKCFTQTRVISGDTVHDLFEDHTNHLNGELQAGFDAFGGTTSVERILYIGDVRLKDFIENSILSVHLDCPNPGELELTRMLEWEYFDGVRWMSLGVGAIELEFNAIALTVPKEIVKTSVNGVESYWIRGKLSELPSSPEVTIIDTIKGRLEVLEEGVMPDAVILHTADDIYTTLDLDKNFYLFGKEPTLDTTVYIKSDRIISHKNATFKIEVSPVEGITAEKAVPTENIILRWEYYNGKRWRLIGRTGGGMKEAKMREDTVCDRTNSFSEEGDLSFVIPSDIEPCEVNGVTGFFVRCRIEQGDYGIPGQYELVEDKWMWRDERPLRPPVLKSLTIKYQEPFKPFENIFVYNDFTYTDFSEMARIEHKPFQPFQPVQNSSPTLFISFEREFPNHEIRLFFSVVEKGRSSQISGKQEKSSSAMPEQTVAFEYFNGKTWQNLFAKDETNNFTKSGFLIFTGPKDMRKGRLFGENLFWIRARLEMGGYIDPPRISHILLNSVYASNITTYGETILGNSDGTPNQSFRFLRTPVLPGQKIAVLEKEKPSEEEILEINEECGEGSVWEDRDGGGFWVVWKETETLYDSNSNSRHYTKDIITGEIKFGDGIHGKIPPKGDRNIRAFFYQVGGGEEGNLSPNTLTVLKQSIAFIDGVTNIFPATGGSNLESIEEVKMRAPHLIRSRERAVTAEDFEWLAIQSTNSVARVKCLPSSEREGEVTVIVVPRVAEGSEAFYSKLIPSTEILRRVKNYLNERRLVCTIVNVTGPRYRDFSIRVEIIRLSGGTGEKVKKEIQSRLKLFLHPLCGGKNRKGWQFGRSIFKADLYPVVEDVEGVDFVDSIKLYDIQSGNREVDVLKIGDAELPYLVDVEVFEKQHERII